MTAGFYGLKENMLNETWIQTLRTKRLKVDETHDTKHKDVCITQVGLLKPPHLHDLIEAFVNIINDLAYHMKVFQDLISKETDIQQRKFGYVFATMMMFLVPIVFENYLILFCEGPSRQ